MGISFRSYYPIGIENCGICLDEMNASTDNVVHDGVDGGKHGFHRPCLATWLNSPLNAKKSCPSCKVENLDVTNLLWKDRLKNELSKDRILTVIGSLMPLGLEIAGSMYPEYWHPSRLMMLTALAASLGIIKIRAKSAVGSVKDKISDVDMAVLVGACLCGIYTAFQAKSLTGSVIMAISGGLITNALTAVEFVIGEDAAPMAIGYLIGIALVALRTLANLNSSSGVSETG